MARMKVKLGQMKNFKLNLEFNGVDGTELKMALTVRHVKRKDFLEAMNPPEDSGKAPMTDCEFIKYVAVGWDLEDEFNDENIEELVEWFPSVVMNLYQQYMIALIGQRAKN